MINLASVLVFILCAGAVVSSCMYASNVNAETISASHGITGYQGCLNRSRTSTTPPSEAQKYCAKVYLKKS